MVFFFPNISSYYCFLCNGVCSFTLSPCDPLLGCQECYHQKSDLLVKNASNQLIQAYFKNNMEQAIAECKTELRYN